jgi:hypothetical protein
MDAQGRTHIAFAVEPDHLEEWREWCSRMGFQSKAQFIGNAAAPACIFAIPTDIFWNARRLESGRITDAFVVNAGRQSILEGVDAHHANAATVDTLTP